MAGDKAYPEAMETFEVQAAGNQEPLRVDKFLLNLMYKVSRSRIQQAIEAKSVWVNGKEVKANYKVRPKDVVRIDFPRYRPDETLIPEDIPLDVMFEDDDVLLINKPAGLVVHPGVGNWTGTLVNALMYRYKNLPTQQNEYVNKDEESAKADASRAGIVHRLDKNTSGVMVVAKTPLGMKELAQQFFDRTTHRRYYALVWGETEDEGRIEGNIGRDLRNEKVYRIYKDGSHGKHAVTHYKTIERFGYVSLVECRLETGRTHQIRVHMESIGHPLFNDEKYGGDRIRKGTVYAKYKAFVHNAFQLCPRQALHAKELGFHHPRTGEYVLYDCPLPEDMQSVIDKWRDYMYHVLSKNL
tara:strand:- start:248 stop:1312 length:1065 start_codon:yes stop_codon:yes gene_type:complete